MRSVSSPPFRSRLERHCLQALAINLTLALAAGTTLPVAAFGEAVSLTGAAGIPGAAAASGGPGGQGGAGEDVTAAANALGESNFATARGGAGGDGAAGGDALPGSGADGGVGGGSGAGGDAIANATASGAAVAEATAEGGRSGMPGSGGLGDSPGLDGAIAAIRAPGGDALAGASVSFDADSLGASTAMRAIADASGGDSRGGAGGNATATASGSMVGAGDATTSHRVEAFARAGVRIPTVGLSTGSVGGAAADATGATTSGELTVDARANAAASAVPGSPAGGAIASASGTHRGEGRLNVMATSVSTTSTASESAVSAVGTATNGADVSVGASLTHLVRSDTGRVVLRDSVGGSTSGALSLFQGLWAVGEGEASLAVTDGQAESLALDVDLIVGTTDFGRAPELADATAVLGDVVAESQVGAAVTVDVDVNAPSFVTEMPNATAGSVRRSQVAGISNGGDVSVDLQFEGSGGVAYEDLGTVLRGEDGSAAAIDDVVTAETAGAVALEQIAVGGRGAEARTGNVSSPGPDVGIGGEGGSASNRLVHAGTHRSLGVFGRSTAGWGGDARTGFVTAGDVTPGNGGAAFGQFEAHNLGGSADLQGVATGGRGGESELGSGHGGDAVAEFRASTEGDGNGIEVGVRSARPRRLPAESAVGGDGGLIGTRFVSADPSAVGGDGGDATSVSEGVARGDSVVSVYDFALGGDGGGSQFGAAERGTGGDGGHAHSHAIASGGGLSRVLARSRALGGSGGSLAATSGVGGNARSLAQANGSGEVESISIAEGGSLGGPTGGQKGSAIARAEASGAAVTATAEAIGGRGGSARVGSLVRRTQGGTAAVEARVDVVGPLIEPVAWSGLAGAAAIAAKPTNGAVADVRGRDARVDELVGSGRGKIGALAAWKAASVTPEPVEQRVELDITLDRPDTVDAEVVIAISVIDSDESGFDALDFSILVDGVLTGGLQSFSSLVEASDFFAELIGLGDAFGDTAGSPLSPAISLIFDVDVSQGQSIAFDVAALIVPEPSTGLLVALGLAFLGGSRGGRRERSRRRVGIGRA